VPLITQAGALTRIVKAQRMVRFIVSPRPVEIRRGQTDCVDLVGPPNLGAPKWPTSREKPP
jgi:hypothetical protein